jgi:hypothetical protein
MGWFRSRSSLGSYLALFALAVQLVLSFGHVHLEGGAPTSPHGSALFGIHPSATAAAPADPGGRESPALADDYCPICALTHLAGTLVLAEAPSLPRLAVFSWLLLAAAVEFDIAGQHHSPLRARAPPLA